MLVVAMMGKVYVARQKRLARLADERAEAREPTSPRRKQGMLGPQMDTRRRRRRGSGGNSLLTRARSFQGSFRRGSVSVSHESKSPLLLSSQRSNDPPQPGAPAPGAPMSKWSSPMQQRLPTPKDPPGLAEPEATVQSEMDLINKYNAYKAQLEKRLSVVSTSFDDSELRALVARHSQKNTTRGPDETDGLSDSEPMTAAPSATTETNPNSPPRIMLSDMDGVATVDSEPSDDENSKSRRERKFMNIDLRAMAVGGTAKKSTKGLFSRRVSTPGQQPLSARSRPDDVLALPAAPEALAPPKAAAAAAATAATGRRSSVRPSARGLRSNNTTPSTTPRQKALSPAPSPRPGRSARPAQSPIKGLRAPRTAKA